MRELSPQRFVNTISEALPLEDWSCLKTGVARVLGERGGKEARSTRGSLRTGGNPNAARRILQNTGVGSVQREGCGDADRAGDASLSVRGCAFL